MMRSIALLSILLSLTLVYGCAPRGIAREVIVNDGPLLPSLQVYTESGEVHFILQVTNVGDEPVELRFPDGQTHDFEVMQGEREIWRWSDDQQFTQALREERLDVGESLRLEGNWTPAPSLKGDFVAIARLAPAVGKVAQAARFRIQ